MGAGDLIGLLGSLVGIGIAAWFARRRHLADPPHATRLGRIFYAALAFALVQHFQYSAWLYLRQGGSEQLAANFFPTLVVMLFAALLILFPLELVLGWFVPVRSRAWLAGAVAVFALLGALFTAAPFWLAQGEAVLRAGLMLPALSSAAAALIWWAFLPPPPDPA
ncbi:hypothetical protein [Sphingosinicella terrae]|uniref:hypothetical protein n=1 Tax=Sphingosinicella terrae TaxID=2172047 RepID=UPI000E0DA340|nr:hypothetical protein [Sphingosinicella terrae]